MLANVEMNIFHPRLVFRRVFWGVIIENEAANGSGG